MSWKLVAEVRRARLAGQLPNIGPNDFMVLLLIADTCRHETTVASLSVAELVSLTGIERTTVWRSISKLEKLGYVVKLARGNQFQAARLQVSIPAAANTAPNSARCTDATCSPNDVAGACFTHATCSAGEHVADDEDARCADATCSAREHVAELGEHVADDGEHVANQGGARCTGATLPEIPSDNPEEYSRGWAREAHPIPPPLFCPTHMPDGPGGPCPACGDRRRYSERWAATPEGLAWQREAAIQAEAARMGAKSEARERRLTTIADELAGRCESTALFSSLYGGPNPEPRYVDSERIHALDDGQNPWPREE